MARLTQGILGGVLGKVGNVVGSSWKGIPVIKAMPLSVANPRTALQVAQRTKMTYCVDYGLNILTRIIKPLNDRFAQKASGWNDYVRRNIHLFSGISPSPAKDLVISVGKMEAPILTASRQAGGGDPAVMVSWTSPSDPYSLPEDLVYCFIYQASSGSWLFPQSWQTRSTTGYSFNASNDFDIEEPFEVYAAFRRADGTVVSNTGYVHSDGV